MGWEEGHPKRDLYDEVTSFAKSALYVWYNLLSTKQRQSWKQLSTSLEIGLRVPLEQHHPNFECKQLLLGLKEDPIFDFPGHIIYRARKMFVQSYAFKLNIGCADLDLDWIPNIHKDSLRFWVGQTYSNKKSLETLGPFQKFEGRISKRSAKQLDTDGPDTDSSSSPPKKVRTRRRAVLDHGKTSKSRGNITSSPGSKRSLAKGEPTLVEGSRHSARIEAMEKTNKKSYIDNDDSDVESINTIISRVSSPARFTNGDSSLLRSFDYSIFSDFDDGSSPVNDPWTDLPTFYNDSPVPEQISDFTTPYDACLPPPADAEYFPFPSMTGADTPLPLPINNSIAGDAEPLPFLNDIGEIWKDIDLTTISGGIFAQSFDHNVTDMPATQTLSSPFCEEITSRSSTFRAPLSNSATTPPRTGQTELDLLSDTLSPPLATHEALSISHPQELGLYATSAAELEQAEMDFVRMVSNISGGDGMGSFNDCDWSATNTGARRAGEGVLTNQRLRDEGDSAATVNDISVIVDNHRVPDTGAAPSLSENITDYDSISYIEDANFDHDSFLRSLGFEDENCNNETIIHHTSTAPDLNAVPDLNNSPAYNTSTSVPAFNPNSNASNSTISPPTTIALSTLELNSKPPNYNPAFSDALDQSCNRVDGGSDFLNWDWDELARQMGVDLEAGDIVGVEEEVKK